MIKRIITYKGTDVFKKVKIFFRTFGIKDKSKKTSTQFINFGIYSPLSKKTMGTHHLSLCFN